MFDTVFDGEYVKSGRIEARLINALDNLRTERHQMLYETLKTYNSGAVSELIDSARIFLNIVNELPSKDFKSG